MNTPPPMTLANAGADIHIPDGAPLPGALARTTHLGIGAHADDLEFMALHGILECYASDEQWFGGITCTDGGGSARSGPYATHTDEQVIALRSKEQQTAADTGKYAFVAQLAYPSSALKQTAPREPLVTALHALLCETRPHTVYTHNPFDKHPTHVAVLIAVVAATLKLPPGERPAQLIGCEVWRGLDWLPDPLKHTLPIEDPHGLGPELAAAFKSQIAGGKRYDRAVEGRHLANATFLDPRTTDNCDRAACAIDLTSLIQGAGRPIETLLADTLQRFTHDITHLHRTLAT